MYFLHGSREPLADDMSGYCVTISGLLGGHSGADVDKERGNANVLMGRLLYSAMERFPGLCLIDVQGGEFDNVIRSNCAAAVAIPVSCRKEFEVFVSSFGATLQNEYADTDANVTVSCEDTEAKAAICAEDTAVLLRALMILPNGDEVMSASLPGLMQTSLNLGILYMREDGLHLTYLIRFSIASQMEMLVQRLRAIVETAHGEMAELSSYPGCQYARNSSLRETALAAYRRASVTVKERSAQPMAASNAAWLQQRSPTLTLSHSGRSCMMCIRRTSD